MSWQHARLDEWLDPLFGQQHRGRDRAPRRDDGPEQLSAADCPLD